MSDGETGAGGSLMRLWLTDIAGHAPHAGPARWRAEGDLLLRGWREPHRRYHTLVHLGEMFQALRALQDAGELGATMAGTARLAAWYHDLAYDPRAAPGSNEHRSATLARDHLHRLGVAEEVVALVEELILMTVDHQERANAPATQRHTAVQEAFHDADLWILSAPDTRFDEYCAQVRQEYAHVPPQAYAVARARILRALVERGPVYHTAHARRHWQHRAVDNVARELARLG